MKRLFAVFALAAGIGGLTVAAAPVASADPPIHVGAIVDTDPGDLFPICIHIHVALFGNTIVDSGPDRCIPGPG